MIRVRNRYYTVHNNTICKEKKESPRMQQKTHGRKGATAIGERYLFWGVSATIVERSGNGALHIKANREWVDEPMPTDL
eukprot:scaffold1866_cov66-Cylindrotheca_fusiformis.AAC.5